MCSANRWLSRAVCEAFRSYRNHILVNKKRLPPTRESLFVSQLLSSLRRNVGYGGTLWVFQWKHIYQFVIVRAETEFLSIFYDFIGILERTTQPLEWMAYAGV